VSKKGGRCAERVAERTAERAAARKRLYKSVLADISAKLSGLKTPKGLSSSSSGFGSSTEATEATDHSRGL